MDKKQKQTHPEVGEDATQYGEFISTYFAWIPLPNQKEKAGKMAKMTEKDKTEQVQNAQEQNGTEEGKICPKIHEKKNRPQIHREEK